MLQIEPIGIIRNLFSTPTEAENIRSLQSEIELYPSYEAGLLDIEKCRHLEIVYLFHKTERIDLIGKNRNGEVRGIFACRSPFRPNHIGRRPSVFSKETATGSMSKDWMPLTVRPY